MKGFKLFLTEKSHNDFVVVFSGRFQPFTKNHYSIYEHLVKKFGKNKVYIGTSDKTEKGKSPFTFKEKQEIMYKLFRIPKNKIVKVNRPYKPLEIMSKFDGDTVAYVAAVGGKDAERLSVWPEMDEYDDSIELEGYEKKVKGEEKRFNGIGGYYYVTPFMKETYKGKLVSGTLYRKYLSDTNEEKAFEFFKEVYSTKDKKIFDMMRDKLS